MLYLIKSQEYVKIGYTDNLKHRLMEYNIHNPCYQLLDTCQGTMENEHTLHKLLKKYKHRNEWFHYNEEVINIWNNCKNILNSGQLILSEPDKLSKEEVINFLPSETKILEALKYINNCKSINNLKEIFLYICEKVIYSTGTINMKDKFREIDNLYRITMPEYRRIIKLCIKLGLFEGSSSYFIISKNFLNFNNSNNKSEFILNVKNMLK